LLVIVFYYRCRSKEEDHFLDLREKFPFGRAHLKIEFHPQLRKE